MKKIYYKALLILFVSTIFIAGCGNNGGISNNEEALDKEKLTVVATFYSMYDFTKNVAKDKADVQLLIPSGVEPHDWEPSPKDVKNIQRADLFIYNSEHFETWVPTIEKSLQKANTVFVKASDGITLIEGNDHEHKEEGHDHNHSHEVDPHVWLSPVLAQKEVETITKALIEADPDNQSYYEENSKEYINKLKELDNEYRASLEKASSKEFITQHAAFGYLANEYGLKEISISGLSPSQEPSPAKLAELKKFAKEHHVKAIYFEELASPKVAETLAKEIGAETEILSTLEGLSKESQDQGLDYIKVMKNNLKALEKSLH